MSDETRYERIIRLIRHNVTVLNEVLGLTDAEHKVTFGYIGNDRSVAHYVFFPHLGRCGTFEDRIGAGFNWDDEQGAQATLVSLVGAVQGARLATRKSVWV